MQDPTNGIYVHVPFCRGKCHYCGFYSVASGAWRGLYLDALERETRERASRLPSRVAHTLYLGGGTPSALSAGELERVINGLEREIRFLPAAERTIEVNPEDISRETLAAWRALGFNRLSVGVQSFSDERLRLVHRRHTARQAIEAIDLAAAGFDNIGVDLILGLPGQTAGEARRDVETLARLPARHASIYLLSLDPGSIFAARARRGELLLPPGDEQAGWFADACDRLRAAGFDHYEISNFARDGRHSRHNSAYWHQGHYLGLGPAAHSHDGRSRRWNIAHVKRYAEGVLSGTPCFEEEVTSDADRYNEYVMTSLRTARGASEQLLRDRHAPFYLQARAAWDQLLAAGHLARDGDRLRLTETAWLISDTLLAGLFHAP
ncbi:MAG: radical SAM family heme chaperone HemW [Odoribacteraceae bacterium]|jgi:oxygen-independent coproporphyrinogen-3 oxidase|nr:radical SAM family heme chaperone HemW [Odoribacteraceae bacterium]